MLIHVDDPSGVPLPEPVGVAGNGDEGAAGLLAGQYGRCTTEVDRRLDVVSGANHGVVGHGEAPDIGEQGGRERSVTEESRDQQNEVR